jgi:3-hydroxyisobutyrate dehydrogenase-like beta-hydroxyacid dehydrogenase
VWKAFVVQFTRETGTQPETFSGRLEHMSSGRRATFASAEELLAALARMLGQLGGARV